MPLRSELSIVLRRMGALAALLLPLACAPVPPPVASAPAPSARATRIAPDIQAASAAQPRQQAPPPRATGITLDVQSVNAAQPRLLAQQFAGIAPHRPGVVDLYFVGFASFASQDVFLKEARSAQALFDARFDTKGRSLVLINNLQTVDQLPLATAPNLAAALQALAGKIDVEEDVVFLYLTSHGEKNGILALEFGNLALRPMNARTLRAILDRSGIKWRVVVVSACYSGSFIDALRDERTLIVTAAAADRASFGCSHTNEFTYFGEAYLDKALRRRLSFVDAFTEAKQLVTAREQRERRLPSQPQIVIGKEIGAKLEALSSSARRSAPSWRCWSGA
jgi:hypothetical protein